MKNIVLIDDAEDLLKELEAALKKNLDPAVVEVRTWLPRGNDGNTKARFDTLLDDETALVVTDYDLTSAGQTGLFGSTIVNWCQSRLIPVGDFSRGNVGALPKEPSQYEIRIPTDTDAAASYIRSVYGGFTSISAALSRNPDLLHKKRSPAGVLSQILERPAEESRLGLYGARLGNANAALMEQLVSAASDQEAEPTEQEKSRLLTYVLGHLLLNVILRFPGPIMNRRALTAFLSVEAKEFDAVVELFEAAQYRGPFSDIERYFWLADVGQVLEPLVEQVDPELVTETQGEMNRAAIEKKLGKVLLRHSCPRCQGKNGGFWCPFTDRTVCDLPTCSVGSSAWIPAGAKLCRIEKDFYDEWAPVLGF